MSKSAPTRSATPPAGDLQVQLDAITTNTRALVQPERLAITDAAVETLFATRIEDSILSVGSSAPPFALPDCINGKLVHSADLLALGPLIVKFFRGRWCPYCMTELEAWQAAFPAVRERGALLVAISPQLPRQNDFAVQQHGFTFPILSDAGGNVASTFGLTYIVPPAMQQHYRSILINIPFINGDQSWQLPLPATFVIAQSGTVLFGEAHADRRVRPDPSDILSVL